MSLGVFQNTGFACCLQPSRTIDAFADACVFLPLLISSDLHSRIPLWLWCHHGNNIGQLHTRTVPPQLAHMNTSHRLQLCDRVQAFLPRLKNNQRVSSVSRRSGLCLCKYIKRQLVLTTERHYSGSRPSPGHTERQHSGWDGERRKVVMTKSDNK